jgi:very-short-patch-repair endonuclease
MPTVTGRIEGDMNQATPAGAVEADRAGDQARPRVLQLVHFLAEYDSLRNPPVRAVPAYGLYDLRSAALPSAPGVRLLPSGVTDETGDVWLIVDFVEYPLAPVPPAELEDPLAGRFAGGRPILDVQILDAASAEGAPADPVAPAEPEEGRRERARVWLDEFWTPYVADWERARLTKNAYRELFEAAKTVEDNRESYELVWGFVGLRWPSQGVDHPLFVVPVEVSRGKDQSLSVVAIGAPQFDLLPLAGLDMRDPASLSAKRQAIDETAFDPWDEAILAEQARSTIHQIHEDGVLEGEGEVSANGPVADLSWRLFVRRRRPDYQGFLDRMRELYSADVTPPDALASLVIDAPSTLAAPESSWDQTAAAEPLLLPKPSNEEQQRILALAQVQSGVVVQGPPGTGKSHTIANLISHYVAYGKRVLVVAEKEQALRVLKEKVPQEIVGLTVSVLGTDAAGQQELRAAIATIQERAGVDARSQDARIDELERDLKSVDAAIAEATGRLLDVARSEGQTLPGRWPCGQDPTPARAAAWLREHADDLAYIPDSIDPGTPAPITGAELEELVGLLTEVGWARARESAFTLPDLALIPTPAVLSDLLEERRSLRERLEAVHECVDWTRFDRATREEHEELQVRVAALVEKAREVEQPWLVAVAGKLGDPLLRQEWARCLEDVTQARREAIELRQALVTADVEVPEADPQLLEGLADAAQRLRTRGKLGMFAGNAKSAVERCKVDGRPPATAEDVEMCQRALDLAAARRRLTRRWNGQADIVDGPVLAGSRPEENAGEQLELLRFALDRDATWAGLRRDAAALGVDLPGNAGPQDAEQASRIVELLRSRPRLIEVEAELRGLGDYLQSGLSLPQAGPHWLRLRDALGGENVAAWAATREDIEALVDVAPRAPRLVDLRARLAAAAPLWTERITSDPSSTGSGETLSAAWAWRQLETWLGGILSRESPESLQATLEELAKRRRRVVSELVGVRAWRRLHDNLGDKQRAALTRYLGAVRRYGKTGGKFAARWLQEIREALDESKDAVPVWIMTTSRALGSFRPEAQAPFDVIIVDEASQIDLQAVPLLSLARRAIVVGDDEQVSPGTVGQNQQRVFDLIDSHLSGLPNSRVLFNVGNSLYDVALAKFPRRVMLREHFRCLPEIIAFSNQLSYDGKIVPLRDQRSAPGWPALGAVRVLDGYRVGQGTNLPEAHAVVDLVAELVANPRYEDMTIGVVTLLGGGQDKLVSDLLFDRLGPAVLEERQIRVGDASNFQGDERDVIVISLVAATDPGNPQGRIGAFTSETDRRRVNVAASRAREQMWVVHSLEPERFPYGDFRAELIRHCRNPYSLDEALEDQLDRCESGFERDVLRAIASRGYRRLRAQVQIGTPVANFRIDLVVEGPQARLAVECDGDEWHGPDRWHADRARQEILERAGWTFVRIRASAFYRNPDAALRPVWERLEALNIPTGDEWLRDAAEHTVTRREVRGLNE